MKAIVGVDGAKYSEWALTWLGKLPFKSIPHVTAIHGMDLHSVKPPLITQPIVSGYEPDTGEALHMLESRAKQVEADMRQRLVKLGLKGSFRVEQSNIAQSLIKQAGSNGLIVVGSRGLDAIDRLFLGSVSTTVTLHASCPVLVVKEPPHTLRRVLFATDGSPSSEKALQFLTKQFSVPSGAKSIVITLVHVMPFLRYTIVKEAGEELLAQQAAKLEKAGYRVRQFPCVGPAAEEILNVAKREQPTLIVTGATGRSTGARSLCANMSGTLRLSSIRVAGGGDAPHHAC
ncbi:MAG: universal stress protein [Nitrospira sp.]|nr:universal stress protein [Nitrospira sp.]MBH0183401.1 universal stress protein [Nitrospira sp.]MBH0186858.1 universal stress protein [Nitrospira sp.]